METTLPPPGEPDKGRPNSRLPTRRRAWLACTTCRSRKTRCDAAKPRCSLCVSMNVECIYKDSQQPRIEPGIRMLLDRIGLLEDRLLSNQATQAPPPPPTLWQDQQLPPRPRPRPTHHSFMSTRTLPHLTDMPVPDNSEIRHGAALPWSQSSWSGSTPAALGNEPGPDEETAPELPYPSSHTANANHVLNWPIVQELFSGSDSSTSLHALPGYHSGLDRQPQFHNEATNIFFSPTASTLMNSLDDEADPPESWRLFEDSGLIPDTSELADRYNGFIRTYFDEVNIFFPLLSPNELFGYLERVVDVERNHSELQSIQPPPTQYCLLLLVLCIGSFVGSGGNRIRLPGDEGRARPHHSWTDKLHDRLWSKVLLLLGFTSSAATVEAAQCTMLARCD